MLIGLKLQFCDGLYRRYLVNKKALSFYIKNSNNKLKGSQF
jgi:hypothetical protein